MSPPANSDLISITGPSIRGTPASGRRAVQRIWYINVLVVDDDAADSSLITHALQLNEGVAAVRALANPGDALRQLASGQIDPDLVLLDLHMPQIDGFEFLRRMREIPALKTTPVVFLTSSARLRDAATARDSTAVFYIIKPDTYSGLKARLDLMVKRTISGGWKT
jgi:CheY-like chemotaxis protein